jgi:O-antigen/teichoic acid export membrane protein
MADGLISELSETSAGAQQFRTQVGYISRQSGVFFAGTIFTVALGYVFKVYLARVLGAEALGIYALGMTLVGFIGMFNSLGLPGSAVRFVAAYRATGRFKDLHALLWRGAGLLLVANIVVAVLFLTFGRILAVHFYHSLTLERYLPWFAFIPLVGVLNSFYGKVLAGYRDLKLRTLIVNFIGGPLTMLLAVLLISFGLGLRGYLLAQILSGIILVLLLLVAVRHFTPAAARFSALPGSYPEKEVWHFSTAMVGIGFLEFIMTQADKIALGYFRSPREVGIYSVAAAVVAYVPLVLSSVNQIFAPTIADLHSRGNRLLLSRLFQSLTKWVMGLTLPLALVVIMLARPFMRMFGHEFEHGWPILVIGTLGQLINCGVGSVGYILLMAGHERRLLRVQMTMAATILVLTAILVPLWGAIGAAAAAAVANIGTNLWNLYEVRKRLGLSPYNLSYFRLFPAAGAAIAALLAVRRYSYVLGHDWLIIAVALGLAYTVFACLILLTGLDSDDRLIAGAIWSRIGSAFAFDGVRS